MEAALLIVSLILVALWFRALANREVSAGVSKKYEDL